MTVRTVITAVLLAVLLAACGDPELAGPTGGDGPDPPGGDGPDPPGGSEVAIAPGCDDLGPVGGPATARGEPPEDTATGRAEPPETPGDQRLDLAEDIRTWVAREAAGDFGGMWMDPPGSGRFTLAFTRDVEAYRAALLAHLDQGDRERVRFVEVTYSEDELGALQEEIGEAMAAGAGDRDPDDGLRPSPGTIVMTGRQSDRNRVSVGVVGGDDGALAELTARYGADRICLEVLELPAPMDPDGPVRPLAKVDAWRDGFSTDEYALAEVAYDAGTAERAWSENVPEGLPERDGDPVEEGLYGALDGVDFATHAVVVWSAGQSGGCPGWLADIDARGGAVVVEHGSAGVGVCTDDYNPYRMVLAVERDRLPEPGDLPQDARGDGFPSGVVTHYP